MAYRCYFPCMSTIPVFVWFFSLLRRFLEISPKNAVFSIFSKIFDFLRKISTLSKQSPGEPGGVRGSPGGVRGSPGGVRGESGGVRGSPGESGGVRGEFGGSPGQSGAVRGSPLALRISGLDKTARRI